MTRFTWCIAELLKLAVLAAFFVTLLTVVVPA